LEKQDPGLADSFATDFKISTKSATRLLSTGALPSRNPTVVQPTRQNTTVDNSLLIDNMVKQYQNLSEDGQKDL
jgi:hypothetical protein